MATKYTLSWSGLAKNSHFLRKSFNGGLGRLKKSIFLKKIAGTHREKGGVSICTHKNLVDLPRRLVQITIVSLWAQRDHEVRLNETKMASETTFRVINNETIQRVTLEG